jgi:hypothetical protein
MEHQPELAQSDLFSLRVWREVLGNGQVEWRGKLQHVVSGQFRYFHGWPMLLDRLSEMLPAEMPREKQSDSGRSE